MGMAGSWQDVAAIAVGALAVIHLVWRWWPRATDQAPTAGPCSHCDSGCKATACPTEAPIRVIPASPKP